MSAFDERMQVVRELRELGALRVTLPDLEVVFAPLEREPAPAPKVEDETPEQYAARYAADALRSSEP